MAPQTYIIAQNPAVLAQLMRENESRSLNPSAYTTPASVFNTLAVDFDTERTDEVNVDQSDLALRTIKLPACDLLKLDPMVGENVVVNEGCMKNSGRVDDGDLANSAAIEGLCSSATSSNSNTLERYDLPQDAISENSVPRPPEYPIPCEIINALTQQTHSIDPMYKALQKPQEGQQQAVIQYISSQQQPPQVVHYPNHGTPQHTASFVQPANFYSPDHQYLMQSFQQTGSPAMPGTFIYPAMSPQMVPISAGHFPPGQPFTVVYGAPPDGQEGGEKCRSLERNPQYAARVSSLERVPPNIAVKPSRSTSLTRQLSSGPDTLGPPGRSGSLERSGLPPQGYGSRTNSLERSQNDTLRATGGSLERNPSTGAYDMKGRNYRGGSLERNQQVVGGNRGGSLERNPGYGTPYKSPKQPEQEPFQEEIYDFGGANVKSCAAIALKKSIAKGLIPSDYQYKINSTMSPAPPPYPGVYHQQRLQHQQRVWGHQIPPMSPIQQQHMHHASPMMTNPQQQPQFNSQV